MNVIVTDEGFCPDTWTTSEVTDLGPETAPETLDIDPAINKIRIDFPSSSDGRGFTLARLLRLRGYSGELRAKGHVICEQYAMARRSGFDSVEIDQSLADRQPEELWLSRANWQKHDYQERLRSSR
ncbi:MAG: DUF934 domain-containing protein [Marinovum sp.]|nr:DUF934 domain-containing protein [Marinovum sp.]MDG1425483.1 DUF934 domain-containing protein [Paracoccaceae bacterium]MBT6098308.1 DUF934 domain-containing protein [Marinovum sp.]MBT6506432.1 DUF934 domain-containing protein [Marinovum sp.]MBT6533550.1 DUF934 domain-containing protein [Marinovum sp.]